MSSPRPRPRNPAPSRIRQVRKNRPAATPPVWSIRTRPSASGALRCRAAAPPTVPCPARSPDSRIPLRAGAVFPSRAGLDSRVFPRQGGLDSPVFPSRGGLPDSRSRNPMRDSWARVSRESARRRGSTRTSRSSAGPPGCRSWIRPGPVRCRAAATRSRAGAPGSQECPDRTCYRNPTRPIFRAESNPSLPPIRRFAAFRMPRPRAVRSNS